jgi:mRNA interferase RelE/StbE
MAWTIEYTDFAIRQIGKLDKATARKIADYLEKRIALLDDPRSLGKSLSGKLASFWRYRVGDYRIICNLQDEQLCVLVVRVGHRKEIYR